MRRSPSLLSLLPSLLLAALLPGQQQVPAPDPATVQRFGPAYRYPQDGFLVLHVEGKPYERGVQHGRLLAEEITAMVRMLGHHRARGSAEDGWKNERLLCNALFLRGYDPEYLAEMRGTADGANAAGARVFGRRLDVLDIAAINSSIEVMFLEDGLAGLPTGLEAEAFAAPRPRSEDHCSAFAATGPATRDGKIVFGHLTMFMLPFAEQARVWLDVQPDQGHRVLMQTFPGGIWSGLDWYQNDAGMLLAETTIGQTRFDKNGLPLASRVRRAIQYGDSIDAVVAILQKGNNGLYSNEWLLGDTKTNEIAMFELGTAASRLWRSSKDEWVAGTKGFYWGCNNERELAVRLEQLPSLQDRPRDLTCRPSDRDCKWLELFAKWNGRIDVEFGRVAFTTPPLAASHSMDGKVTTTELAGRLQSFAMFGAPMGLTWLPSKEQLAQYPEIAPICNHDWTLLGPAAVPAQGSAAIDLGFTAARDVEGRDAGARDSGARDPGAPPPAWRGTLLPASDADLWLPIAFARHESLVAAELQLDGNERDAARALAAFQLRAQWQDAVRTLGKDVPLTGLVPDARQRGWAELAASKGTQLLEELRTILGDEAFCECMDAFGTSHAGQRVRTADFLAHVEKSAGRSLDAIGKHWLEECPPPGEPVWSVTAFEREPERTLIVYGTAKEGPTNREAAELLQRRIAATWHNFAIPIVADGAATEAQLQGHHLVLVGRPASNRVGARLLGDGQAAFPVRFGASSCSVAGTVFGHERTAVIAAGKNPLDARFALVVYAGLSSDATRELVQQEPKDCEVMIFARGGSPVALAVTGCDARIVDAAVRGH